MTEAPKPDLAALTRNAEPPVTAEPEAPPEVGPTAILREWFGGKRYARDYEYLDANFMANAKRVAALVATPPAPTAAVDGAWWIEEREDDAFLVAPHWNFGKVCVARKPKLMTNEAWQPIAEQIIAGQAALKVPAPEAVAPTGTAISDAMIDRALVAYYGGPVEGLRHLRSDMIRALEAALSAPTGEGEAL